MQQLTSPEVDIVRSGRRIMIIIIVVIIIVIIEQGWIFSPMVVSSDTATIFTSNLSLIDNFLSRLGCSPCFNTPGVSLVLVSSVVLFCLDLS